MLTENFDTYQGPFNILPDQVERICAGKSTEQKRFQASFVIKNAQLVTPDGVRENASVRV
jgi:hypothetical protein